MASIDIITKENLSAFKDELFSELRNLFELSQNGSKQWLKSSRVEVRLTDPGDGFSPYAVMNFYSATYPILTNAKLSGPEIRDDEIQYRFESTMGTKG